MLDNDRKWIEVLLKNDPTNFLLYAFKRMKYTDLVSVQPMTMPVGQVFQNKTTKTDSKVSTGPITSYPIEAISRPLSLTHQENLFNEAANIPDVKDELNYILVKELSFELDRELRKRILDNATKMVMTDIGKDITKAYYTIMQNTTYSANRIVVSPKLMIMLLDCPLFNQSTMQFAVNDEHSIDVIVDEYADDVLIIGYVGNIDSGIIYSPYKIESQTKNGHTNYSLRYSLKVMDNVSNYYIALTE